MILSVDIAQKAFGPNDLFNGLSFTVQPKEKIGIIGRNSCGKSTLFQMITGQDADYDGTIQLRRGTVVAYSRQEHSEHLERTVLAYILGDLPQFAELKHIIDTYPASFVTSTHKQAVYADAVSHFASLGYFEIEDRIVEDLKAYQIDEDKARGPLRSLSGGQKRLIELVKIQFSNADLVLIDEPTNHMDYVAKENFIRWMNQTPEAMLIITHDRDVLKQVDRIVEIRDGLALSYKGNYDDYLRVNAVKIVSELHEFSVRERRIANLKEDVIRFRRLKEKSRDPGTISRFKSLEQRAQQELVELSGIEKPTFWIDKESSEQLNDKVAASYEKHKARNIRLQAEANDEAGSSRMLVDIHKLSLGYDQPLFQDVTARMNVGSRLRIHGRNGAGKTTLINAVLASVRGDQLQSTIFSGFIDTERGLKVGVYRQEVEYPEGMTLEQAIEDALRDADVRVNDTTVRSLMDNYLFDPASDGKKEVKVLSGGQKARLQLIAMLAGNPQLLILDEPTNHLDLPSIEELEAALQNFSGAVLYISHDSYFAANLPAETINIDKTT